MKFTEDQLLKIVAGICTLVLGVLGWLAVQVYDMKGELGVMNGSVTNISGRVDRIAEALPSMAIQVAEEELERPFALALVSTEPTMVVSGTFEFKFHLVDTLKQERTSVSLMVSDEDGREEILKLNGLALSSGLEPISFSRMEDWSFNTGSLVFSPFYINSSASFISRRYEPGYIENFQRVQPGFWEPVTSTLDIEIDYWGSLVDELQENSGNW